MSAAENKDRALTFYALLQEQAWDKMRELVHPDFTFYTQIDTPNKGIDGFIECEKGAFDAFPDFTFPVYHILAEGDIVMAYLIFSGTHTGGDFFGLKPTGKKVRLSIAMCLKFLDGKLLEFRAHYDKLDEFRQLGLDIAPLIEEMNSRQ